MDQNCIRIIIMLLLIITCNQSDTECKNKGSNQEKSACI